MKTVVTIVGGSAPVPEDPAYVDAKTLGRLLARSGYAIATGGYVGTMEAASRGAAEAGGHVIGVTCERIESWRPVRPNAWIHEEVRCTSLQERLFQLLEIGSAVLALPGGVGTLAEVAMTWSLLQTGELSPRPLVLMGRQWQGTMDFFLDSGRDYVHPNDARLLTYASGPESAARILQDLLARPADA